jgi:serine/threonine protein kinase
VLKEMQHENIVVLIKDVEDPKHLVMALEYLRGGGLLEHLGEVEHYSEAVAAQLFTQMLLAVQYMHSRHIMHRDIKPENLVFAERVNGKLATSELPKLKLVDFGLARNYSVSRSVKARLGSPGFMAPEVRIAALVQR